MTISDIGIDPERARGDLESESATELAAPGFSEERVSEDYNSARLSARGYQPSLEPITVLRCIWPKVRIQLLRHSLPPPVAAESNDRFRAR
jgi:hypothetical protein